MRTFNCSLCEFSSSTSLGLRFHLKEMHDGVEMTDQEIREKAIADVAEYSGFHFKLVAQDATQANSSGCIGRAIKYAVSQREQVIRHKYTRLSKSDIG